MARAFLALIILCSFVASTLADVEHPRLNNGQHKRWRREKAVTRHAARAVEKSVAATTATARPSAITLPIGRRGTSTSSSKASTSSRLSSSTQVATTSTAKVAAASSSRASSSSSSTKATASSVSRNSTSSAKPASTTTQKTTSMSPVVAKSSTSSVSTSRSSSSIVSSPNSRISTQSTISVTRAGTTASTSSFSSTSTTTVVTAANSTSRATSTSSTRATTTTSTSSSSSTSASSSTSTRSASSTSSAIGIQPTSSASSLVAPTSSSLPTMNATAISTTTPTCAPSYTDGLTTISGTGTLPKPTAFVTRNGVQLQLSNAPYRIVGPNIYWLGLDENVSPVAPPSKSRVREAMAIAVAMGANTIRSLSLGISVGSLLSIEPSLNVFNGSAFDALDYALFAAREYGLRVILTLTDEYDFYTGGKYTFLRWLNASTDDAGSQFYTNTTVIATFENYINHIIARYNPYSKTYYYNDPTILAWETGNEFGGYIGKYGYPPLNFTNEIARYIKSIDQNHLVIDGTDGFWNYTTKVIAPGVNSSYIDVMSDHLYPLNNPLMAKEQQIVTQYSKGFLIGQYDWTGLFGGSTNLSSFISGVEATDYIGDMLWNVMGHDDQCCQYVVHNDGYSLYYPNGNPSLMSNVLQVVQHWYRMTGRPAPTTLPGVSCPQPVF